MAIAACAASVYSPVISDIMHYNNVVVFIRLPQFNRNESCRHSGYAELPRAFKLFRIWNLCSDRLELIAAVVKAPRLYIPDKRNPRAIFTNKQTVTRTGR